MKKSIYMAVYKSLEKEVISLSESLHFIDAHLGVYSIKIAVLLQRCVAEIESLFRDLYQQVSGNTVSDNVDSEHSLGKAISYLDKEFELSKKEVRISALNFWFSFNKLTPMNYIPDSGDDYYKAYNAVKHNRSVGLSKANLNVLLKALASLYILNVFLHLYK
jgi:hypothetical protein